MAQLAPAEVDVVIERALAELPFDEALTVADSALRHGDVTGEQLEAAMGEDPQVRLVVAHATPLAARPASSSSAAGAGTRRSARRPRS